MKIKRIIAKEWLIFLICLFIGLANYVLHDYLNWKEESFLKEEPQVVDLQEELRRLKERYEPEGKRTIIELPVESEPRYRFFMGGSRRFFLLIIPYFLFLFFRSIVWSVKQLKK